MDNLFSFTLLLCVIVSVTANTIQRPESRIIHGEEATPGEFPFMATLFQHQTHLCGAAVIASDWLVTAAHCVEGFNMSDFLVVTDIHDFGTPGSNYQTFEISEVITHPRYGESALGSYLPFDIALVRVWLNGRSLAGNMIPVAESSSSFVGDNCVMLGWGMTETGHQSDQLIKADVTALSYVDCLVYWGYGRIIENLQLCVKGYGNSNGNGACNHDNGGPVVCRGQLAGVISWGDADCNIGVVNLPTVCTSTGYLHDWIRDNCDCI